MGLAQWLILIVGCLGLFGFIGWFIYCVYQAMDDV
jgi:hypothetical protein